MVNINIDPCRAFSGCRHHLCCHGHLSPCACGNDTLLARESLGNLVFALRHPLHSDVTNPHSRPQTTGNMKENYVLLPFSLVCVLKPLVSFFIYLVFFFRDSNTSPARSLVLKLKVMWKKMGTSPRFLSPAFLWRLHWRSSIFLASLFFLLLSYYVYLSAWYNDWC